MSKTPENIVELMELAGYQILDTDKIIGKWGNILKPILSKNGYKHYKIHLPGFVYTAYEHRIIASKFIPNPENQKHGFANGLRLNTKAMETARTVNSKAILDKSTGKIYQNARIACEELGLNPGTIKSRLNGRRKNNTSLIYAV